MDAEQIIDALELNEGVFRHLLAPDSPMDVFWKPEEKKWCLLEIVCHLKDEEVLDFRSRTEHILEYPELPMPEIDPPAWVERHSYLQQDFLHVLQDFIKERRHSVIWLRELENAHWEKVYHHADFGEITAFRMLANWLAHDYLHIRQINRLRYQYLKEKSGVDLDYAGDYGLLPGAAS
ncbi:MAG: DinB family protein [Bacteroidetes bacterium]|nr:DinB family protein [Bacteroidota bacterium]